MNAEFNSEGMIIYPENLVKCQLPKLGFFTTNSKPTLENTAIEQILNSPHGDFSLLLHGLIVIRANEDPMAAQFTVEEIALDHKIEEPITILDVVGI